MAELVLVLKKLRLSMVICIMCNAVGLAQEVPLAHYCASDSIHARLMQEDAEYRQSIELNELRMANAVRQSVGSQRSSTILTIPIVIHIMHSGEAQGSGANISDAQVQSAIVALNEDFRKLPGSNGDGDGVDTQIEFCLASVDPNGNPTSGINRVNASVVSNYAAEGITAGQGSGASELDVKTLSRWNRNDYYNIWIVSEIEDNNGGSGIQGYAYYPSSSPSLDGAVILYNAFGTVGDLKFYTSMNRVTTHELGHAFFLYHTFYGGSCNETNCSTQGDRVCDTPPTSQNSSCNSPSCSGTQQVENYLDYTNQTCQNMFTQGQKDRMRDAITQQRPSLLNSLGCSAVAAICTGDLNGDGQVSTEDFVLLNSSYGQACSGCAEDLNGDGSINLEDFLLFNSVFGTSCWE